MALYTRWLVALAALAIFGCVLPQDIRRLDGEDAAIREDVREMRAELREEVKKSADFRKDAQKRQREQKKDLENLQMEINRLQSKLDEALYNIGKKQSDTTTAKQASSKELKQLSDSIRGLKAETKKLSDRINIVATHVGLKELVEGPARRSRSKRLAIDAKDIGPETEKIPGEREYMMALDLFRQRRFIKALAGFQNYLKRYPATELSDNAILWMGECYYSLKDYRQAILAYEKLLRDFPNSAKVPGALLKEGMAFKELGEKTSAAILLKMVVKNHPRSEQAVVARKLLESLKK